MSYVTPEELSKIAVAELAENKKKSCKWIWNLLQYLLLCDDFG